MQAHNLSKSGNKKQKRIGRGGKRGSFSGRGIKGQKARAGRKIRPQIRDIIKKLHKRRGYGRSRAQSVNANKAKIVSVNLREIDKKFKDGDKITPKELVAARLVKMQGDKMPKIKILGNGKLTKKLIFEKIFLMSKSAKEKIG